MDKEAHRRIVMKHKEKAEIIPNNEPPFETLPQVSNLRSSLIHLRLAQVSARDCLFE